MEIKLALKVNDKDNVATIFANGITDGTEVEIRDKKGNAETVTVIGDVPYGHKIAVRDIKKGELINKYGEEIGIATKDIKKASTCMSTTWTACAAAVTGPRKASKEGKLLWNLWVMCARTAKLARATMLPSSPALPVPTTSPTPSATRYRVPLHICTIRAAARCPLIWSA